MSSEHLPHRVPLATGPAAYWSILHSVNADGVQYGLCFFADLNNSQL